MTLACRLLLLETVGYPAGSPAARLGTLCSRAALPGTEGCKMRSQNAFLSLLSDADFELLRPDLKRCQLHRNTLLVNQGQRTKRVYFPETGFISMVVRLATGAR